MTDDLDELSFRLELIEMQLEYIEDRAKELEKKINQAVEAIEERYD